MDKKKRRNHSVPRMLLKNFTDKEGKLYFFDRRFEEKRILKTTPDALYRERDLYVVRDEHGNMDDSAEDLFAEFEREAAPVFDKIITEVRWVKEPVLTPLERHVLDRYVYFQWARVPDTAGPILDHTLSRLSLEDPEISDLSPRELAELGKGVNVESLVGVVTKPGGWILSYLLSKSLAFVLIRRKNKSFVIGSRPVLQVFPDPSDSVPRAFTAMWLPLAYDVAVAYGEGEGGVMEFTEDRELRRFNENVFRQSRAIAGRSDKLIASLADVAIGKAGKRVVATGNKLP